MLSPFGERTVVNFLGSPTNGATVTAQFDCQGYDYLSLDICAATADVVSNKPTTIKLSESDTTDATNFSDIPQFVGGGTSGGFTIPNADTSNINVYRMNMSRDGRRRYIKVTYSPRTTQQVVACGRLRRGKEGREQTNIASAHVIQWG